MNKTKNVPHEKLGQGEGVGGTPEWLIRLQQASEGSTAGFPAFST